MQAPNSGQYDQLNISGHAQLNGLMTIDLLNGFVPDLGDMFDIMNFANASGTFSLVMGLPINGQEHFTLEYNPTNLTLDVVAGPLLEAGFRQGDFPPSDIPFSVEIATTGIWRSSASLKHRISALRLDYGRSSPTPEPGSLLLLGSGLLCVGYGVRRRMTK